MRRSGSGPRTVWVTLATILVAAVVGVTYLVLTPETTLTAIGERVARLTPVPRSTSDEPGVSDGRIGDEAVSVRDTDLPAIANLAPDLRAALTAATRDAKADGVRVLVNSGWRSRFYQQQLLDDAIDEYGSRAEALRWVSSPETSHHITGDAVDVGHTDAAYWMQQHGVDYGLCQAYDNEIWHYELLTEPGGTCPASAADGAS